MATTVTLPDGTVKIITDELCTCGALKSKHNDRFGEGHGDCPKTNCQQFTWKAFVFAGD